MMLRSWGRRLGGLLLLILICLRTAPVKAQQLDPTFPVLETRAGTSNFVFGGVGGHLVDAVVPDAQGRYLISGRFDFVGNVPAGNLFRMLPSGALDGTFNAGGSGANGTVAVVRMLASGKILIGGSFTRYNGRAAGHFARLNADGSLDTTFNAGGLGADQQVRCLAVDAQGRVLLGGDFDRFNGVPAGHIARLLPSGAIDPGFAPGSIGFTWPPTLFEPAGYVSALKIDGGGRILAGGQFRGYNGRPINYVARLTAAGMLDTTFAVHRPQQISFSKPVFQIEELPGGKLLLAGRFLCNDMRVPGSPLWAGLIRIHADGLLDTTFHQRLLLPSMQAIQLLANGKILASGNFRNTSLPGPPAIVRFNSDGTVDNTFTGTLAAGGASLIHAIQELPGGKLLVGGNFYRLAGQPAVGLGVLTATGALDPNPGITLPVLDQRGPVWQVAVQPDDRLLVRGSFVTVNGQAIAGRSPKLIRLTANGVLDPSFQLDSAVAAVGVRRVAVGPGGQIYIASANHIRRLTPAGAVDPSFDDGAGITDADYTIEQLLIQPDGRLLLAGRFQAFNWLSRTGLVRLETDGRVDTQFAPPSMPVDGSVLAGVALRADRHVLFWTGYQFAQPPRAERFYCLDAVTGAPVPTFNNGRWLDSLHAGAGLPDTSMLVLGPRGDLFRLTPTGTVHSAFQLDPLLAHVRFDANVPQVLPNGKVLVYADYRSNPQLWCLRADGSVDPQFAPIPVGTDYLGEELAHTALQSTGQLLLAGSFLNVGRVPASTLVRIGTPILGIPPTVSVAWDAFPNPTHDRFTLRRPTTEPATATLLDVLGRPVRRWSLSAAEQTVSVTGLPIGTYIVRVVSAAGVFTRRVVVE